MIPEIKQLGDKTFYVVKKVPVVKSMVLNNAFLPLPTLKKSLRAWNMKPIVFGHPEENGQEVSAAKESKIADHVGFVSNSSMDGDRMRHDLYLDKNKIDNHPEGQRFLQLVKANKPINVSTAYFDGNVEAGNGIKNGKTYDRVQKDIEPDHLAILLNEDGACACKDGCGINVNNKQEQIMSDATLTAETLSDSLATVLADFMKEHDDKLTTNAEKIMKEVEDKITANAAMPAGSTQDFKTCMDAIDKLSKKFEDMAKPKTNAQDTDNDEEDYESMSKKKKDAVNKNEDKGDKKYERKLRTHSVKFETNETEEFNPNIPNKYYQQSLHDYLVSNSKKGA